MENSHNRDRNSSPSPSPTETRVSTFSSAHYGHHGNSGLGRLPNPPTFIEWKNMRFLIMDAPSDTNLDLYIREMKRKSVTNLVRVCDPTYNSKLVEENGIFVHEMVFPDGEKPSDSIITSWLDLVNSVFSGSSDSLNENSEATLQPAVAVHCVAGLGRAPVLVAIALIESGMSALDAVSYLRDRRRGAINNKQLRFLESYRCKSGSSLQKCSIM